MLSGFDYHNIALILFGLIVFFVAAFSTAKLSLFLHWCMGEPNEDYEQGRIFSWYGRFISSNYVAHMDREETRLEGVYFTWLERAQKEFNREIRQEKERMPTEEFTRWNEGQIIAFNVKCTNYKYKLLKQVKLSVWKPLGACFICFMTWVSITVFITVALALFQFDLASLKILWAMPFYLGLSFHFSRG